MDECLNTSATICAVPKGKRPTSTQTKTCYPNLKNTISDFKPHIIVAVGDAALESLVHNKFKKKYAAVSTFRGFLIPDREYNAWLCPILSPSYVLSENTAPVAKKILSEDLKSIAKLQTIELPSRTTEDINSKVEIIKHTKDVNLILSDLNKQKDIMVAFDYETTGLKPQHPDQRIRSVSIATDVDHVIAFPFDYTNNKFLTLFAEFLANPDIHKLAVNMKYENDWSNVHLKIPVNSWMFDPMIAQHVIDNRPAICSLDFQAYQYFGIKPYSEHVTQYLKSADNKGNSLNTVFDADLHDLLLYNGIDSLLTFSLAIVQMELIGIDFKHLYDKVSGKELCPQYFLEN